MITHTATDVRVPFWKQLLGALVGASIALGVYAVYTFVSPYVLEILPASITTPRVHAVMYSQQDREVNQDKVIDLAREIARRNKIRN